MISQIKPSQNHQHISCISCNVEYDVLGFQTFSVSYSYSLDHLLFGLLIYVIQGCF